MRGKEAINATKKKTIGITPAYAGKSRQVELFCHMP